MKLAARLLADPLALSSERYIFRGGAKITQQAPKHGHSDMPYLVCPTRSRLCHGLLSAVSKSSCNYVVDLGAATGTDVANHGLKTYTHTMPILETILEQEDSRFSDIGTLVKARMVNQSVTAYSGLLENMH